MRGVGGAVQLFSLHVTVLDLLPISLIKLAGVDELGDNKGYAHARDAQWRETPARWRRRFRFMFMFMCV